MRVGIVVPCFNREKYLGDALDSIIAQRLTEWQCVIVDDCSTDDSYDIARKYVQKDRRIQVVKHPRNLGLGAARTTGVSFFSTLPAPAVDGFAFLDADDFWAPDFLVELASRLDKSPLLCKAAFAWSYVIDDTGVLTGNKFCAKPGYYHLATMLAYGCPPANGSSLLIKRNALVEAGPFADWPQGTDTEMWLRILAQDPDHYFECIGLYLTYYRRHSDSITAKTSPTVRGLLAMARLERYIRFLPLAERGDVYLYSAERARHQGLFELSSIWETEACHLRKIANGARVSDVTGNALVVSKCL